MSLKKEFQNRFHDFVHSLTGGALDFFEALSADIENSGGKILRDAAMAAVVAAEQVGGSGEDKAKAALASVIGILETEGIPVAINTIEGAIKAAVAKMRASDGVA